MGQGARSERVGDQIRAEVSNIIARELHDPGLGFITITRVQVSPDLHHARVYYTALGDQAARKNSGRALERAAPFMRRLIGQRLRLRRAPELDFVFDQSIEQQDRIEQLLQEIAGESGTRDAQPSDSASSDSGPGSAGQRGPTSEAAGAGRGTPATDLEPRSGVGQRGPTSEAAGAGRGAPATDHDEE
jgi:ribosome-binding factor A